MVYMVSSLELYLNQERYIYNFINGKDRIDISNKININSILLQRQYQYLHRNKRHLLKPLKKGNLVWFGICIYSCTCVVMKRRSVARKK